MYRLYSVTASLILVALLASVTGTTFAEAQQRHRPQARPAQRPPVIIEERRFGPPPPPSSDRHFYGPAPSIQPPMERARPVPPLAQPPINRP